MKKLCIFFFITFTIRGLAQTSDIYLTEKIKVGKVYDLNLKKNEVRIAALNNKNKITYDGGRAANPKLQYDYFYGFPDGTYYITSNSYVDRSPKVRFSIPTATAIIYFKRTKIYDNDDDEKDARIENVVNIANRPKSAKKSNNNSRFELKISHTDNKSIILNEEYVIVINIPDRFQADQITFLYNETGKEIFESQSSSSLSKGYEDEKIFDNPIKSIYIPLKTKNINQFSANDNETITIIALATRGGDLVNRADLQLTFLGNNARAHDPNDILVKPTCIDSRNIPKELDYTVRFQNIGEVPAKNVLIDVDVPDAIDLNPNGDYTFRLHRNGNQNSRLQPLQYEVVNRKIKFKLTGFNLKGTNQEGVDEEESKAEINFKLPLKPNYNKKPIKCKATILFEDGKEGQPCAFNISGCEEGVFPPLETITTESAITTYKKFHSLKLIKIKLGLDYIIEGNTPGLLAGVTASPSSCKLGIYNQYELNFFYNRYTCNDGIVDTANCVAYTSELNSSNNEIDEWEIESSTYSLGLVPLQLKYDLTNTTSIGAGLEVRGSYRKGKFHQLNTGTKQRSDFLFDASVFADFNFFRFTQSYGIRYLYGYHYDFSDNGIENQFVNRSRAQIYFQYAF